MREINQTHNDSPDIVRRASALFSEMCLAVFERTDKLFAGLLVFQWLAEIAAAKFLSPTTWAGAQSQTHIHVWAAIFLGGAIAIVPIGLAFAFPGRPVTRHTIAIAQMLTSGLLIHLTDGRIETHFHYFGSLAFWPSIGIGRYL